MSETVTQEQIRIAAVSLYLKLIVVTVTILHFTNHCDNRESPSCNFKSNGLLLTAKSRQPLDQIYCLKLLTGVALLFRPLIFFIHLK